jgi:hypothetical protein
MRRPFLCALLAYSLAACSGSGVAPVPSGYPRAANARVHPPRPIRHRKHVRIRIRVRVPGIKHARNPRLLHSFSLAFNTQGIKVVVSQNGSALGTTVVDISAGNAPGNGCTVDANGDGGRVCSFPMLAPVGDDAFVITTYDAVSCGAGVCSIPPGAHQLGYGAAGRTIAAGTSPNVSLTLSPVLGQVTLDMTPPAFHTLFPMTATVGVYAMDDDYDVIVSSGFIDANGNPVTIALGIDNNLGGALSLSTTSLSAPAPDGVQLNYTGNAGVTSTTTLHVTATPSSSATAGSVAVTAIYPAFTTITDANLSSNQPYHDNMIADNAGGVYYTNPNGFGGLSYYSGSGSSVSNWTLNASQPMRGGIAQSPGLIAPAGYVVAGNSTYQFSANPGSNNQLVPNATGSSAVQAPVPNGGGMAYDSSTQSLWYTSGTQVAKYPVSSGAATTYPLSYNVVTTGGIALDGNHNVWIVDSVNNAVHELQAASSYSPAYYSLGGCGALDIIDNVNASGAESLFVTQPCSNDILQLGTNGSVEQTIDVPNGAQPYYVMADNAQAGVLWFDYYDPGRGQIGIGRVDTNVSPAVFSMATDVNAPTYGTPGGIAASSSGLVYMIDDNASALVQVSR